MKLRTLSFILLGWTLSCAAPTSTQRIQVVQRDASPQPYVYRNGNIQCTMQNEQPIQDCQTRNTSRPTLSDGGSAQPCVVTQILICGGVPPLGVELSPRACACVCPEDFVECSLRP